MRKQIKNVIAMLLVFALLLAGCGGSKDISGKVEAPAPVQTQPPETTVPENPLSLGRMEGGTYTNSYAGFGCTLDSSWVFYSAEELQELPENVASMFEDGSDMAEVLRDREQIMDMQAENIDLLYSMNVLYQKVSLQERLLITAMGEAEMIDTMIKEQGQLLIDSYAQMGMEITGMERRTVNFLGQERSALYTTAITQGVNVFMVQLFDYSRGSYSVTSTFSSYLEDNTQNILDLFFAVE